MTAHSSDVEHATKIIAFGPVSGRGRAPSPGAFITGHAREQATLQRCWWLWQRSTGDQPKVGRLASRVWRTLLAVLLCSAASAMAVVDPADYTYSMKITFADYQQDEALTNFPALVKVGPQMPCFRYTQFALSSGADLRFTAADQATELNYEVEEWNTNGTSFVWVQVPLLTNNAAIWAYWGNTNPVVAFSPADLSDLQLWLRADVGVETNAAGGVTNWVDQSGVGNDVSQSTASNQPTVDPFALNGHAALHFNRALAQQLTNAVPDLPTGSVARSVFVVVRKTLQPEFAYPIAYGVDASNQTFGIDVGPDIRVVGFDNDVDTGLNSETEPHIYAFIYDGATISSFGDGAAGESTAITYDTQPGALHVGNFTFGNFLLDGDLAELLVYEGALSATDHARVGAYLENKYGLNTTYVDPAAPTYTHDGSTWSEHFDAVFHLAEKPADGGAFVDSVADHSATFVNQTGNSSSRPVGITDSGVDLTGTFEDSGFPQDYVDIGDGYTDFTGGLTYNIWAYPRSPKEWARFIELGQGEADNEIIFAREGFTDNLWYEVRVGSTGEIVVASAQIEQNAWQMFTVTHNGSSTLATLYKNGVEVGSGNIQLPAVVVRNTNYLGNSGFVTDDEFHGILDEATVSTVDRSSNWVWATYQNIASNENFNAYSDVAGVVEPLVSNEGGATDIAAVGATLNGSVTCTGAVAPQVFVYWGPTDGGTVKAAWSNSEPFGVQGLGPLSTNVTGLTPGSAYFYRFYASNTFGESWSLNSTPFNSASGDPVIANLSASSLTITSAVLNGTLISTGAAPTSVSVFYGTNNAGTAKGSWMDVVELGPQDPDDFSPMVSGLQSDTFYFYRFYASNEFGEVFADTVETFSTLTDFSAGDLDFKMPITFSGYTKDGALTNFPALVILNEDRTGFHYDQFASSSGGDLRFSAADQTTTLRYEIESWNDVDGDAYVWVQVPLLTNGTVIYAWWGNPDAAQAPHYTTDGSTWSEDFDVVYHLDDDFLDSTANKLDSTPYLTTDRIGVAAHGEHFIDANHPAIVAEPGLDISNKSFTVTAWAKRFSAGAGAEGYILSHGTDGVDNQGMHFGFRGGTNEADLFTIAFWGDDLNSSSPYPDTTSWHLWSGRFDANTLEQSIFLDGQLVDTRVANTTYQAPASTELRIGDRFLGAWFDGGVDEVRVSGVARSSNWLCAAYMNGISNASFVSYGATVGASRPVVSNEGGVTNLTETTANLHGRLHSIGGFPSQVFVYWGRTDGERDTGRWDHQVSLGFQSVGAKVQALSSLSPGTPYFYRYRGLNVNGEDWAGPSVRFTTPIAPLDPANYCFRTKISFTGYTPNEALHDFPVLVVLNEALSNFNYSDFASLMGGDLRFTDADGVTVLPYEVESWKTNGDSHVWVKVPELQTNDCIYAYWGNTNDVVAPAYTTNGAVWSTDFDAVFHLHDDFLDASAYDLDGTNTGSTDTPGQIADGQAFDQSSGQYIHAGPGLDVIHQPFTVSAWAKRASNGGGEAYIVSHGTGTDHEGLHFGFRGGVEADLFTFAFWGDDLNSSSTYPDTNDWHLWTASYDRDIRRQALYRDGVEIDWRLSNDDYQGLLTELLRIGERFGDARFDGDIDEVRIASASRSTNWAWAAWLNQKSNTSFAAYSPVEDLKAFLDTDGDGIPDFWEILHFGGPTNANAHTDSDGDTVFNYDEYVADTVPTNGLSFFMLEGLTNTASYSVYFDSSTGRVYTLQYLDDLPPGLWSNVLGQVAVPGAGPGDSLTDTNTTTAPVRHYRVGVNLP